MPRRSLVLVGPDASTPPTPVYELRLEVDAPVVAITGAVAAGFLLHSQLAPAYCAPLCDASRVDALDRGVAGRYDTTWARSSDVTLGTILVGSVGTLMLDEGAGPGLSDAVVVIESLLTADALSVVSTTATRRPRPFMYSEKAPLADRNDGNGALSFFSGHTAGGFAMATSLFSTVYRRHRSGPLPWLVLGAGLGAASFLGTTRVLAGQHFPTDVVAGALVGSSVGFLVPALHGTSVRVVPTSTGADGRGVGVAASGIF